MAFTSAEEAEFLRELESKGLIGATEGAYSDLITKLGNELIKDFRKFINNNTKGSGNLASEMKPIIKKNGFAIEADFYYDFVDLGVKGAPLPKGVKPISNKVTNGVYSFKGLKTSKEMFKRIREIVPGNESAVWGAMINIKKRGIKPHKITENVVTDEVLEKIAKDLGEITGIVVTASFNRLEKK